MSTYSYQAFTSVLLHPSNAPCTHQSARDKVLLILTLLFFCSSFSPFLVAAILQTTLCLSEQDGIIHLSFMCTKNQAVPEFPCTHFHKSLHRPGNITGICVYPIRIQQPFISPTSSFAAHRWVARLWHQTTAFPSPFLLFPGFPLSCPLARHRPINGKWFITDRWQ